MIFYTEVNSQGIVVNSMFTQDANTEIGTSNRLLPDAPPQPGIGYIINEEKAVRIEPVPSDATEITYKIVKSPVLVYSKGNEVEI